MRYVAAYLLANLAGNGEPNLAVLEKILSSVGIECDKEKANKVISELKGKKIDDLIKEGSTKLASMPAAGAAPAAAPAAAAPKAEESKFNIFNFLFEFLNRRFLLYLIIYCI
jgi:large subunit ribosomal protein LP2